MIKHPEQYKIFTDVLIALSWLAVIFAVYGYLGSDIVLASTQWLLIAAVLSLNAIYFAMIQKNK